METESKDLHSYYSMKITRWKGNYPRVFSIGMNGVTTYNPGDAEVTNSWPWNEVYNLAPQSTGDHPNQFQLTHKKGKGTDSMRFETDYRAELLTYGLARRKYFARSHQTDLFDRAHGEFQLAQKYRWGQESPDLLNSVSISCIGVEQLNKQGEVKIYYFKDIECVLELKKMPNVFALKMKRCQRLHIFSHQEKSKILQKIVENSNTFIGINVRIEPLENDELPDLFEQRLGLYSADENIISLSEFAVQDRNGARTLLCLSESCIIERDPGTYLISSLNSLSFIFALVRCEEDTQAITVEFSHGASKKYFSTERDSLLASLMDGARASGNWSVHVKSKPTPMGKRWGPASFPVDEKVESMFLKFLHQPPPGWSFSETMLRFNTNIEYSGLIHAITQNGLFAENKEKLILVALNSILTREIAPEDYEEFFHLIRRLVCSKTAFGAFGEMQIFREKLGAIVVSALKSNMSDCVVSSALEVMAALMQPMHTDPDLRQEQDNKEKILSSTKFIEGLLDMWSNHVKSGTGAVVTMAMLDILTFALCAPYSETTTGGHFDAMLQAVASRAKVLYQLFQHPSVAIVKGAGLVMKALIEEGQGAIGREMQEMAVTEGAILRHLLNALFVHTNDPRLLTLRQLSRHLITLWTCDNRMTEGMFQRVFPFGLLGYLDSNDIVELSDEDRINTRDNLKIATNTYKYTQASQFSRQLRNVEKYVEKQIESALKHWRLKIAQEARKNNQFRPVVLRKRRQNLKSEKNWNLFYHQFYRDHAKPDLIWNYQTREELRECLQNEIRLLDNDKDHVAGEICWNHADFCVQYPSLNEEIRVGGYYLKLLLEEDSLSENFVIKDSKDFFSGLYHRFLLTGKAEMRGMCLQAMSIVYDRHWKEIGSFQDLKYIIVMLEKCSDKMERDKILIFLKRLVNHPENARELVNCGGIRVLIDLITLAHLHTSRALIPTQTNVIEAGAEMKHGDSPEWYYFPKDSTHKIGPIGFKELKARYKQGKIDPKTKCWASGLDTWKQLGSIAQLKWFILCEKQPSTLDESKVATTILDTLIQIVSFYPARNGDAIVRPIHKAKQILSDPSNSLAHIVQLLLTFDPPIVERVAVLLYMILEENPVMSRVYATGVYFFIMMYTGSNILPISRFLALSHLKQNTYVAQQVSTVWQKSVLGSLLPEAMVAYIENHGTDKFSEIFLGEFDTPEAIWSGEMRRQLIEKIALHIADFTPRLMSNTRALYEYCAIPAVTYPDLENELFCNIYYLRNLTDETRFPEWPIADPLSLLRDVLEAWKNEVEKKPPPMTVTEALRALGLEGESDWNDKVKKSYRRLAQMYHPDKNPQGREKFEEANRAYEFLCSRFSAESSAPDSNRIVLILKTQSILFKRYSEVLEPYKYSGYPMLIKSTEMEVSDEALFAKETPLLPHCLDVVYHTLNCSALNVEELRREKGLPLLLRALDRCVSVLNDSSTMQDVATQVCLPVTRCFAVATGFQLCRDKLVEMPQLAQNLCRILKFTHLTKLCYHAAECAAAMSKDTILQMHLLQSGVLWHLIKALFSYDFTLEECGVEASESTNQQTMVNNFAKMSVTALKSLCGDGLMTPINDVIRTSLDALVLPYGAKMMREKDVELVLKTLNGNCRTPYLIWNNQCRIELLEFCDQQLVHDNIEDMSYGSNFSFSLHKGELVIGSVFVRVYNEDPSFKLENPEEFVDALLLYLSNHEPSASGDVKLKDLTASVDALSNVLRNNVGLEGRCSGKFRLFTRLIMHNSEIELSVLNLLTSLMGNQNSVSQCVGMGIVPALLVITGNKNMTQNVLSALSCLSMISNHSQVVKEAIQKGVIVYLLDLFCTSTLDPLIRQKSSEILSKLSQDKLSGPRVKILLCKFLPLIFCEAMCESPASAVQLFDSNTENPEIVWDDSSRIKVRNVINELKQDIYQRHRQDLSVDWKLPAESFQLNYGIDNELVIGGIYIRIYVSNPSWNVRKPREFFRDLLEFAFSSTSKHTTNDEHYDLVSNALSNILENQPYLCDALLPMGYFKKILSAFQSSQVSLQKVSAVLLRCISKNHACLEALCSMNCIRQIMDGIKKKNETLPLICEALNHLFQSQRAELISQALQCDLINILLDLLKSSSSMYLGHSPAATKAHIVNALQHMTKNEKHAQEVHEILSKSDIWAQYRDQKHDLFLTDRPTAGYLGSGGSSVSGYLTQGSVTKSSIPTSPPPLIE